MLKIINDKEFEAVLSLSPIQRYSHFIKQVADFETVWSLGENEGWYLAGDGDGNELVPVWPHERYALACAIGKWANGAPRAIELSEWMEKWIPGMLRDGRQVAVFPTPSGQGIPVHPSQLKDDLEEELLNYE